MIDINKIQNIIKERELDGWLLYDFRGSNYLALSILKIPKEKHLSRRFYYFIPKEGTPIKIVNAIEAGNLDHLPGNKLLYASYESLFSHLQNTLSGLNKIAMEYSPLNSIPYLSTVDAGTIEAVKQHVKEIVSSADLISLLDAIWTEEQFIENKPVAEDLYKIVIDAFNYIGKEIRKNGKTDEFSVQQFIMNEFKKRNYYTDHPPIVGVNENSANPHYAPTQEITKEIKKNDFVLIDLWAKVNKESGVWADITWNGFVGDSIPDKYINIFNIVKNARDASLNLIKERFKNKKNVRGYEADAITRKVIDDAGYGEYFIHRTGHSITTSLHGSGAHLDNFESKDDRLILPGTSFSIEPGIYLSGDFGIRSEIDVYISNEGEVIVTGGKPQEEIYKITV
jgi:Xaa-Pro dipeptidase